MNSVRDMIIEEQIETHYPSAKIDSYLDPDAGLSYYTTEEIKDADKDWFPLCAYQRERDGRVVYGGRKGICHTYIEGETGAGKTTRFAMQSIRPLLYLKDKPSFLIVDIHGELQENLYQDLKKNEYDIRVLNCDNPDRSDTYNPMFYMGARCLQENAITHDAGARIRRMAEIIQPIESTQDPIWDIGAQSYTCGSLYDMVEDVVSGDLPLQALTIYNLIQRHFWLRKSISGGMGMSDITENKHYKKKGDSAISVQKMMATVNNAERTRSSYFGVVENHYDSIGQPAMYALSSDSTINIDSFVERPTALFIKCANTTVGDTLIGLLVNDIYTKMDELGKMSADKRAPRKVHCFLDEFANCNIADAKTFLKMLTTSRKFGMNWHLMVQSDSQIDQKYGVEAGKIIRSNCTEIFMGSNDYETLTRFAKSCGRATVESVQSVYMQQAPSFETVELLPVERLSLMEYGTAYVKVPRGNLLHTYYEAYYKCDEIESVDNIDDVYPHNTFDYTTTRFTPDDIPGGLVPEKFEVLCFIAKHKPTKRELIEGVSTARVETILNDLKNSNMVRYNQEGEGRYEMILTPAQYEMVCIKSEKLRKAFLKVSACENKEEMPADRREETVTEDSAANANEAWDIDNLFDSLFDDDEDDLVGEDHVDEEYEDLRFVALRDFVSECGSVSSADRLEKFSAVPSILIQAYRAMLAGEGSRLHDNVFHQDKFEFEIIESFVKSHDFKTKKDWVREFRRQTAEIKQKKLLPVIVIEEFDRACLMLDKDLTLSNIQEIRQIILSAEDDTD